MTTPSAAQLRRMLAAEARRAERERRRAAATILQMNLRASKERRS